MTNKAAQFTPGPWVVNTFIVNGQHKLEVLDATGANACIQANAHLIAAAPAMYEALRMLITLDPRCHRGVTHCGECGACLGQVALAQAEGR